MSEYSGFKIKRPHSQTPLTSVYEAVAVDGRPGRFALKIFHPPASTNARRVYAIEGWLLAAERQQQSAKKDGAVVEVLAFGRCEEGAFAVLPWQERVLAPWIKTLHAKGDTLRALAECLLNTIEKWEKETGGPHGNLKPANVFLSRSGPLAGMTAQLSDPAFLPGAKTEALRLADLNAVGTMLATIVRRRLPGAWPIEEAPEWKALGNGGKGWLDFCNYLLNPQPDEGTVTLANARLRLKKVPKDANPVKTAMLSLAAVLVLGAISVVAFARFGNPIYMPAQVERLAIAMKNPRVRLDVPPQWAALCVAWDTWLVDLQSNAPRLLRTVGLLEANDPLRAALDDFVANASNLRPEALISQAAGEKRLGVLGNTPPPAVYNELLLTDVRDRVAAAGNKISTLNLLLENWQRWDQLRALQKLMEDRGYSRAAGALASRLPPARGSAEYGRQNVVRTLKFFNDLSLDTTGTLPLASRWSEITHLSADMDASGDRVQKAMPAIILGRLVDVSSVGDFADSLVSPLEEMSQRRKQFLDPQVVRERFLKESPLLAETADVTVEDFPKWEQEIVNFTLVPKTVQDDPRLAPALDASVTRLPPVAVDLEVDAPAGEPGNPATLGQADFKHEFDGLTASLKSLRDRPIVRRDLPAIGEETVKMAGAFTLLEERLNYTLTLLKPEIWLAKVAQAYGTFNESKQRWAAWQQAALTGVTPAALTGVANRPRFRQLRANERQVKEWIDGLEGPTGFGALKVPDLNGTASSDTGTELHRLETVLRERAATAVAAAAEWRNALPVTPWDKAGAAVRAPLEKHSEWLGQLPDFASNLDQLSEHLANGLGWTEGVHDIVVLLQPRAGVDQLAGKPAEWYAEAKQLEPLVNASDRGVLTAAAQSGGLSRKLMAWRQLGKDAGWPGGAAEFDLDGGVVKVMRELVGQNVKDEARRTSLFEEMVKGTRLRFNRAARTSSRADRAEAQLTNMFDRLSGAGLTEADLDEPVAYNLALWRLKTKTDWNERSLDRLGVQRDNFVTAVQAIPTVKDLPAVSGLLTQLSEIKLKDEDPSLVAKATISPGTVGWHEDLGNEGLSLTATWKNGDRNVKLEYAIVQPLDDTPPFYLAVRTVAVGEFVDLMEGRPKEAAAVKDALPVWTQKDTPNKPWNRPLAWRPRSDFTARVLELNPTWIYAADAMVGLGLLDNLDLRATTPPLAQAATEKPSPRSPLQQISPVVARLFADKLLGARLPTTKEWQAALQATDAKTAGGYFRGPNFQKLWTFIANYHEGGQTWNWRPNEGIFLPMVTVPATAPGAAPGATVRKKFADDGQAGATADESRFWFRPVDEGPKSKEFINLTGNISIFLTGEKPNEYYVAGGSVLSPPGIDFTQPQKIEDAGSMIGAKRGSESYSDVGIRPAFDAPPGFKERFKLNQLVRRQKYLTL